MSHFIVTIYSFDIRYLNWTMDSIYVYLTWMVTHKINGHDITIKLWLLHASKRSNQHFTTQLDINRTQSNAIYIFIYFNVFSTCVYNKNRLSVFDTVDSSGTGIEMLMESNQCVREVVYDFLHFSCRLNFIWCELAGANFYEIYL